MAYWRDSTDAGTARRNRASDMGCLRRGGGRDRGDACALLLAVPRGLRKAGHHHHAACLPARPLREYRAEHMRHGARIQSRTEQIKLERRGGGPAWPPIALRLCPSPMNEPAPASRHIRICADSDAVQVTTDNEGLQLRERDDWRLGFPPSLCPRNAAIILFCLHRGCEKGAKERKKIQPPPRPSSPKNKQNQLRPTGSQAIHPLIIMTVDGNEQPCARERDKHEVPRLPGQVRQTGASNQPDDLATISPLHPCGGGGALRPSDDDLALESFLSLKKPNTGRGHTETFSTTGATRTQADE